MRTLSEFELRFLCFLPFWIMAGAFCAHLLGMQLDKQDKRVRQKMRDIFENSENISKDISDLIQKGPFSK